MKTPFDYLEFGMASLILSNKRDSPSNDLAHLLMNFYMIARVLYTNMAEASERSMLLSKKKREGNGIAFNGKYAGGYRFNYEM